MAFKLGEKVRVQGSDDPLEVGFVGASRGNLYAVDLEGSEGYLYLLAYEWELEKV